MLFTDSTMTERLEGSTTEQTTEIQEDNRLERFRNFMYQFGILETFYGTVKDPMECFRLIVSSLPLDVCYPVFAYAINNAMATYKQYFYFKDLIYAVPFYSLRVTIVGPEETFVKLVYDNSCVMKLKSRNDNWEGFMKTYADLFKKVKIDYFEKQTELPFVIH
ncbi:unnamed protein product [Ambrosiozyma monospora]|uniref:Unnamed protein product n=1 Tax=Ambrosiozyma monospora TaxID=43982 RepID=A0ACB5TG62_AMBMO|nr:unnamed protein product [Ambrosiozyma monospora]